MSTRPKLTAKQSFLQIGLPMLTFLLAGSVLLSRTSDPWLKKMDRLQGRSEADFPKKAEPETQTPAPPKRKFDMEEEWKVCILRKIDCVVT